MRKHIKLIVSVAALLLFLLIIALVFSGGEEKVSYLTETV